MTECGVRLAERFLARTQELIDRGRNADPDGNWLIPSQWIVFKSLNPSEPDGYLERKAAGLPVIESLESLAEALQRVIEKESATI